MKYDEMLSELEQNIAFMEEKLKQARQLIGSTGVVIPYNNGGGQSGIRANPAFGEYEKLMNAYTKAVQQYDELSKVYGGFEPDTDMEGLLDGVEVIR